MSSILPPTPRNATVANPIPEPVTLAEAKSQLEISRHDDSRDAHVRRLITQSRETYERDTQSLIVARGVVENQNYWPDSCWRFYHRPVVSVDSVTYFDLDDLTQTLDPATYSLDVPNRRLILSETPDLFERWDSVTINYTAGQQNDINETAKQAMLIMVDIMFELRLNTKEKDASWRAYDSLTQRHYRSNYP